jgi:hypothetical protein
MLLADGDQARVQITVAPRGTRQVLPGEDGSS